MVMRVEFDFSEWIGFGDLINTLALGVPEVSAAFLKEAGENLLDELNNIISAKNIDSTGSYRRGFTFEIAGGFNARIVLNTEHDERLPIYWKVLEVGAKANPRFPGARDLSDVGIGILNRLFEWAATKGIPDEQIPDIIKQIRFRGIPPNPVIGLLFNLDESFRVIGLTAKGELLVKDAFRIFQGWITRTAAFKSGPRAGQTQLQLKVPGQRPRFLPNAASNFVR